MDDLSPNQANRLSGAQGYWGTAFVLALIAHGLLLCCSSFPCNGDRSRQAPSMPNCGTATCRQQKPRQRRNRNRSLSRNPSLSPNRSPNPEPQPEPEPAPEPPAPEEPQQQLPPPPPPIAQTDLDRQANLLEDPDIVKKDSTAKRRNRKRKNNAFLSANVSFRKPNELKSSAKPKKLARLNCAVRKKNDASKNRSVRKS